MCRGRALVVGRVFHTLRFHSQGVCSVTVGCAWVGGISSALDSLGVGGTAEIDMG